LQPAAWTKNSSFLINPLGRAVSCCQQQDANCEKQSPDFLITRGKSEITSRGFQWSSSHASLFLSTGAIFPRMKIWWLCVGVIVGLGFRRLMAESPSPRCDIDAVLAAHDRQLLDLPAVVGVYVGVLADGKTPASK